MTGSLTYTVGDATDVEGLGTVIIPHVCNDEGKWGAGFTAALNKRWPEVEQTYRSQLGYVLGSVVWAAAKPSILIANMIAQHRTRAAGLPRHPIRYVPLVKAMTTVRTYVDAFGINETSIHAPRFGAGLAGGHWPTIEALIHELWVDEGVDVVIYDLPQ